MRCCRCRQRAQKPIDCWLALDVCLHRLWAVVISAARPRGCRAVGPECKGGVSVRAPWQVTRTPGIAAAMIAGGSRR